MPRVHDLELMSNIGRRLREIREAQGITQERLASLIDVDPVTMSRAEHGVRALSISNLARVAAALQVPLAAVFEFGSDPPETDRPSAEHEMLVRFRRLDEAHQRALIGIARELEAAQA